MRINWTRVGTFATGLGLVVGGLFSGPAVIPMVGAGAGLMGLAWRWPGDISPGRAAEQLAPAAEAAVRAAVEAGLRSAGRHPAEVAKAAGEAAGRAAADALAPFAPKPNPYR